MAIRRAHIRKQGDTEAPQWIRQTQRQAAVAVTAFAWFLTSFLGGVLRNLAVIGVISGLVGASIPDITSFSVPRSGLAADLGIGQAAAVTPPTLLVFGWARAGVSRGAGKYSYGAGFIRYKGFMDRIDTP